MPRNIFFNILKSYEQRNSSIASSSSSSSSSSSVSSSIFPGLDIHPSEEFEKELAVIPLKTPVIEDFDYLIKETHISFFETIDEDSDDIGYHHTVTLIDGDEEFKVHVYFDLEGEPRVHAPKLTEAEKAIFLDLAKHHCPPIIAQIKEYQRKRIAELKEAIKGLFELTAAPSVNNLKEIERINEQFSAAIFMVKELNSIGGSMRINSVGGSINIGKKAVLSRMSSLDWMKDDLFRKDLITETIKTEGPKKESKEKVETKKRENKRKSNKQKPSFFASKEETPKIGKKEAAYKDLQDTLTKLLKDGIEEEFIERIHAENYPISELRQANQLAQDAVSALLTYSLYEDNISILDYLTVETSAKMTHFVSIYCIEEMIMSNPTGKIPESLMPFIKYLDEYFVSIAIQNRNYDLLDILLKDGNLKIDDICIEGLHPLAYTYRTDDIQAFRILLKYKPSLHVFIDYEHLLLEQIIALPDNDPFSKALDSIHGKLAQGQQALHIFKQMLLKSILTSKQKKIITSVIEKIELFVNTPTTTTSNLSTFTNRWFSFRNLVDPKCPSAVVRDKEILAAYKEILGEITLEREKVQQRELVRTSAIKISETRDLIDELAMLRDNSYSELISSAQIPQQLSMSCSS